MFFTQQANHQAHHTGFVHSMPGEQELFNENPEVYDSVFEERDVN
eukprot:gene58-11520_t